MRTTAFLLLLASIFIVTFPASAGKELPKIAVWDLAARNIKTDYAQELTSILVSEIAKLKKYEVYSQENVRTLAGWTAERMKLGCTDTQCLIALGQMDIAKLISGSVGKIGNTYSISLNLFDTQNAKAENAISEFCRTEDELICLVQQAARKLIGAPVDLLVAKKEEPKKKEPEKTFTNSIGIEFVLIPAGKFIMGSPPDEFDRDSDEGPQHEVEITRPFYLGIYEVTQAQWWAVMGNNPSDFKNCGDDCPVDYVSWNDVQKFIRKLNSMEKTDKYRLPTEAEWEYACRAGTQSAYCFGNDINQLGEYAWVNKIGELDSDRGTHPVGKKRPNAWGLYDMHGNVAEWCQDWYGEYSPHLKIDPTGPSRGRERVVRGWLWTAKHNRCASRQKASPHFSKDVPIPLCLGFRLVRTP